MGKALLLFVTGLMVTGGLLLYTGPQRTAQEADRELSEQGNAMIAREIAMTAYNLADQKVRLGEITEATTLNGTYQGGSYEVVFTPGAGWGGGVGEKSLDVMVSASVDRNLPGGSTTQARHFVQAAYAMDYPEEVEEYPDVPNFLEYGLIVESNVTLNGAISIEIDAGPGVAPDVNANLHTNGNLILDGRAGTVHGFGTYVGTLTGAKHAGSWFRPPHNPDRDPVVQQIAPVPIEPFDIDAYLGRVTVDQSSAGDVTITGNVDLGGTRENPYIWHIGGNLTSTGGATIDGYVVFVVEGDINLNGDTVVGESGYADEDESSTAFIAGGEVVFGGNIEAWGMIYAEDGINFHGNPDIYGSLATMGTAVFSGTPDIYYRAASPALAAVWTGPLGDEELTFVSYKEWSRVDDAGLAGAGK